MYIIICTFDIAIYISIQFYMLRSDQSIYHPYIYGAVINQTCKILEQTVFVNTMIMELKLLFQSGILCWKYRQLAGETINFHFKYFIDKSIGLDNRLCLYKSSPTTRWNHLNTIYIRHRAIYPWCIHAIHLNYQA